MELKANPTKPLTNAAVEYETVIIVTDKKQLIAAINRQHDNYSWHLGQMKQSFTGMIEVLMRAGPVAEEESTKSEENTFVPDSEVASIISAPLLTPSPVSIPKKRTVKNP
jgi:hypothetical protein